ncbi:MAG: magnesium chelatase ATPase subunit I [Acidobacteria bacterium]|nr:magnesium chelatase ATPase subunit I [Acidobacteriota bacterium]
MSPRRTPARSAIKGTNQHPVPPLYPFTAIVGQDEMKLALLLNAIAPVVGGVLIMGHRGTAKSTAVRALAALLPPLTLVPDCPFNCDPTDEAGLCDDCRRRSTEKGGRLPRRRARVPVVELPLSATEDRVCGTIDFGRALSEGVKTFEPGLLARANRGFLYIDEVNLLEDHLVDLLLDVAATGRNLVEREGVSITHPSRFVLVGSGNPEEGELRPQLLDRFGLFTEIETVADVEQRVEIVARRERFDRDPCTFSAEFQQAETQLGRRLIRAQRLFNEVSVPRELLRRIAELCVRLKVDGHRGELTIARAARALAAFENRRAATATDVRRVAALALRHRLRRDPLAPTSGGERVEREIAELFDEPGRADDQVEQARKHSERQPRREASRVQKDGSGERNGGNTRSDQQASQIQEAQAAPPADGRLPTGIHSIQGGSQKREPFAAFGRQRRGGRKSAEAGRGRFTRATNVPPPQGTKAVALAATLLAAAQSPAERDESSGLPALAVTAEHLRFKRFTRKSGTLFILAVDTSGSMALNRIRQAKGALEELLRQSYVNRDRVALISFRERRAELLLPPSQSPALCKRQLDALPVGGATPLSAALLRALEVARRAAQQGVRQIALLIFTDGRANIPLAAEVKLSGATARELIKREVERLGSLIQKAGVSSIIIDTQNRFTAGNEGQQLALSLGGQYFQLPHNH